MPKECQNNEEFKTKTKSKIKLQKFSEKFTSDSQKFGGPWYLRSCAISASAFETHRTRDALERRVTPIVRDNVY